MPRQGAIVAVLAFSGLASSFMFTLMVPIQSKLPELLDASRDDTAWVVTSTLLAAAVITPISGRLGDMYGKRRIVLVLLGVMIVGSVIAALSPGIVGVIVGRTLQGAIVGVVPLGISILRDVLHEDRVDSAIALISATLGVGGGARACRSARGHRAAQRLAPAVLGGGRSRRRRPRARGAGSCRSACCAPRAASTTSARSAWPSA